MHELIKQRARCFLEFSGFTTNYSRPLCVIAGLLVIGDLELLVRILLTLT